MRMHVEGNTMNFAKNWFRSHLSCLSTLHISSGGAPLDLSNFGMSRSSLGLPREPKRNTRGQKAGFRHSETPAAKQGKKRNKRKHIICENGRDGFINQ